MDDDSTDDIKAGRFLVRIIAIMAIVGLVVMWYIFSFDIK